MATIQPTVGRNLYYWPAPGEREITQHPPKDGEERSQPLHAHILYVHGPSHVTLEVVDHIGNRFVRGDVVLVQDGEPADTGSEYAFWMPYQKAEAVKAELFNNVDMARMPPMQLLRTGESGRDDSAS